VQIELKDQSIRLLPQHVLISVQSPSSVSDYFWISKLMGSDSLVPSRATTW
jgi:hypothetical protein